MKKLLIALLSISILTAAACGGDENTTPGTNPPGGSLLNEQQKQAKRVEDAKNLAKKDKGDVKKLAETYSNIGFQGYSKAKEGAEALKTAIDEFVEAAKGVHNESELTSLKPKLEAAQKAWRDSRPQYLQTEVFRFYEGPINQTNPHYGDLGGGEIEPLVNAWPIDESYIDYTCLFSGIPDAAGSPQSFDDYHCDPLNMNQYTGCNDAMAPAELTSFVKALYPNITDWTTEPTDSMSETQKAALGKVKIAEYVKQAQANGCWLPKMKTAGSATAAPVLYAATNMVSYAASLLGKTELTEKNPDENNTSFTPRKISLDQEYSKLSDEKKKEVQDVIRSLGGGDPIAGQNYGNGENDDNNGCKPETEGGPVPAKCHHIPQNDANVSTGYHALEFLLWGQDFNSAGPGGRHLTDFTPNLTTIDSNELAKKSAQRRLTYLQAVTDMLINDLEWVAGQWDSSKTDNYRHEFIASADTDPHSVLNKILVGMYFLSVNETGGERIQPAIRLHNQEEEHSCFSDNTQVDMQMDIQGIVNVFEGSMYAYDCPWGQEKCTKGAELVAPGTGMKVLLPKFEELCKDELFKDEKYCNRDAEAKSAKAGKLGEMLQAALTDSETLLDKNVAGAHFFDQEVFEHWPVNSQTPNEGYKRLVKLGKALEDLKPYYVSFVNLMAVTLPEE